MAKKVGVILSGCGVYDGSEIYESTITLLAIDRAGAEAVCMAPDVEQMHVINHLTGEPAEGETRNVLVEAARVARGNIKDIAEVSVNDFDALIIPGGFGAAKNLCNFAVKGPDCDVNSEVARLVKDTVAARKPLAAVCIAPALLANGQRQPGQVFIRNTCCKQGQGTPQFSVSDLSGETAGRKTRFPDDIRYKRALAAVAVAGQRFAIGVSYVRKLPP